MASLISPSTGVSSWGRIRECYPRLSHCVCERCEIAKRETCSVLSRGVDLSSGFHISQVLKMKDAKTRVSELQRQLKEAERQLQEEEERGKELDKHFEELRDQPKAWYEADVEELDLNQVKELIDMLLELRTSLLNYQKEISSGEAASSTSAEKPDPSPQKSI